MNFKKIAFIGAGVLVMGSLSWASSGTVKGSSAGILGKGIPSARYSATQANTVKTSPIEAPAPAQSDSQVSLVPPPAELPRVQNPALITSISPTAAASALPFPADVKAKKTASHAKATAAKTAVKPGKAAAAATKPQKLFSYVRMLNFSPHPQEEEFLKDKPLVLNGKKYSISVTYLENWKVIGDDDGYLQKLGFEISLFENGNKIRSLKTPSVALDAKSIKAGQVLGIAEVAPYKFHIAVDSFKIKEKAISEIVFKFDLSG